MDDCLAQTASRGSFVFKIATLFQMAAPEMRSENHLSVLSTTTCFALQLAHFNNQIMATTPEL